MILMKKLITFIFTLTFLFPAVSFSGIGDTTSIRVHDAVHMSWWGEYKVWGVFPPAGTSYRRINLDFTLGCPPTGCSDWDYTVQVEALHKTGAIDSVVVMAPFYTISNTSPDTIFGNLNAVYVTFWNTTINATDSILANSSWVYIHNDPVNPFTVTDSLLLYTGNYYNHIFDNTGAIIDSIYVGYANALINSFTTTYNVFEVVERIELARVITPYGGYYNNSWRNTIRFDITDLAPILQDSVEIRAFYGGWSDGFSITLDFHFIEGTPPRTPVQVRNIYSSGPGGFPYGNVSNPIENYLVPKTFNLSSSEVNSMIRFIPTGHGAGTQNCAEFCLKNYRIKVDGIQQLQRSVWKNDCGLNHLMHQAGTWIYDRANWCPGDKALIHEFEITPFVTPGNGVTLDFDMDAYTNSVGGQNPNYIMAAQLITYSAPNFSVDASVEEIIAPNSDFYFNRSNAICQNPVIVIKNTGSTPLTSATITYGIKGATPSVFNWTGNLDFNEMVQVQLGTIDWNSLTNESDRFYAYVSGPNGIQDQNAWNDTMTVKINFPPQHPSTFVLLFKTNLAPFETSYNIKDDQGNTVFSNGTLAANTIYRDTVTLAPGCYTFNVNDSGRDGLYFFANNDGTGYTRFVNAFGPGVIQYFEADFGTNIRFQFTVGYLLNTPQVESDSRMEVFPNPTSGKFTLDLSMPSPEKVTIQITDALGRLVHSVESEGTDNPVLDFDLNGNKAGIYHVTAVSNKFVLTRKLLVNP
jgi:hypothetical protein